MVVWQGSSSRIESFCHGWSVDIFAWLRGWCGLYVTTWRWRNLQQMRCEQKFHGTCNFDIVRLNNEVLLPTEQILNFNQPDDKKFHFWQEMVKFYKFKPHLNFSYQILLPHKNKSSQILCKKHFKAIKTARIFTRKTKFNL